MDGIVESDSVIVGAESQPPERDGDGAARVGVGLAEVLHRHDSIVALISSSAVLGGLYALLNSATGAYYRELGLTPEVVGIGRERVVASCLLLLALYALMLVPGVAILVLLNRLTARHTGWSGPVLGAVGLGCFGLLNLLGPVTVSLGGAVLAMSLLVVTIGHGVTMFWRSSRWRNQGKVARSLVAVAFALLPLWFGVTLNSAATHAARDLLEDGQRSDRRVFGTSISMLLDLMAVPVAPCALGLGPDGSEERLAEAVVIGWGGDKAWIVALAGEQGFRGVSAGSRVVFGVDGSQVALALPAWADGRVDRDACT